MTNVVSVFAPAKINLYFDILNKRDDGYHEILTLFQTLDLHDVLTFEFCTESNAESLDSQSLDSQSLNLKSQEIMITLSKGQNSANEILFPLDSKNSIWQAINIFLAALPDKPNMRIKVKVEKNIPIGAGLAGGSTDAAATLFALNHYFNKPFKNDMLSNLAAQVGSDVNFCLLGGLAVGRGRGEQLEALIEKPQYHFVLVKPRHLSISTPWAYDTYDQFIGSPGSDSIEPHSISKLLLDIKFNSRIEKHAELFWNAFQPVIFKTYPILKEIKKSLLKFGCISAHLTGSGPTIYGLVENEEEGQRVLKAITSHSLESKTDYESRQLAELDAWLTKSINTGVAILPNKVKEEI